MGAFDSGPAHPVHSAPGGIRHGFAMPMIAFTVIGISRCGCGGSRWGCSEGSSSIGRVPVSKTGGWGFESLLPCAGDNPSPR